MVIIRTLLIILEAAFSLSLIGLILLQKSKDGGLGMAFGAGGNDSLFGARAGNVLTKATVILSGLFLLNLLIIGKMYAGSATESTIGKELSASPIQAAQPAMPQSSPVEMTPVTVDMPVDAAAQ